MIDYSFLRLKDNITDALDTQEPSVVTHYFYNSIQLLPNLSYLQITNVNGGISLDSDCEIFVVDCNDNTLADVTNNIFIEEFTDSNGYNQCKIELVNLGVDFYRQTVLLKFKMLTSDAVFYTNPINITSYQSERTVYFKYKNVDDFLGIGYTNANVYQSISISMYFDIPLDETEVENYFQISRENTISTRALRKLFEQYKIEQINRFTYDRLNALLKHELIYLDDVRVTDKPTVPSSERLGDSNYFETDLVVSKNYNDLSPYTFQVFQGADPYRYEPQNTILANTNFTYKIFVNYDVVIQTGFVTVYNTLNEVVSTFNETDLLFDTQEKSISITTQGNLPTGEYYVHITAGLYEFNNIPNTVLNDNTTWSFKAGLADYNSNDYSNDYFIN